MGSESSVRADLAVLVSWPSSHHPARAALSISLQTVATLSALMHRALPVRQQRAAAARGRASRDWRSGTTRRTPNLLVEQAGHKASHDLPLARCQGAISATRFLTLRPRPRLAGTLQP